MKFNKGDRVIISFDHNIPELRYKRRYGTVLVGDNTSRQLPVLKTDCGDYVGFHETDNPNIIQGYYHSGIHCLIELLPPSIQFIKECKNEEN